MHGMKKDTISDLLHQFTSRAVVARGSAGSALTSLQTVGISSYIIQPWPTLLFKSLDLLCYF